MAADENGMDSGPRPHICSIFPGLSLNYSWRVMRNWRQKDGEEERAPQREREVME